MWLRLSPLAEKSVVGKTFGELPNLAPVVVVMLAAARLSKLPVLDAVYHRYDDSAILGLGANGERCARVNPVEDNQQGCVARGTGRLLVYWQ